MSMNNQQRMQEMEHRLRETLAPTVLDIVDDSHLHRGHAGARDGRGHFTVRLKSMQFNGLTPLQRHRLVYAAMGTLMETDIHALVIEAEVPE